MEVKTIDLGCGHVNVSIFVNMNKIYIKIFNIWTTSVVDMISMCGAQYTVNSSLFLMVTYFIWVGYYGFE